MTSEEFAACQEGIAALTYALAMTMPEPTRAAFMHHLKEMAELRGDGTSADTPRTRLLRIVEEVDDLVKKHRGSH